MKYLATILAVLNIMSITIFTHAQHKLIVSISQPCSLSVAFLRMMRQRDDFLISHEPGVPAWRTMDSPEKVTEGTYKYEALTFPAVVEQLKEFVRKQDTFVKEESYAAMHYLDKLEVLNSPETYTVFLLRDPHYVLLSLYNKTRKKVPGKKLSVVDYPDMLQLFKLIKSKNNREPLIIRVEDLVKNPSTIVKQFCSYANIPFKAESLQWKDLSSNFTEGNETWYDTIYARFDKTWHGDALRSTGFVQSNKHYAVDADGEPTFEEIEDNNLRADYIRIYQDMMPAYQLFLEIYDVQQKEYISEVAQ